MIELVQNNSWMIPVVSIGVIAIASFITILCSFFRGTKKSSEVAQGDHKPAEEVAVEVMAGFWGNGDERKSRLESAGYDYKEIQNQVNQYIELMNKNQ